VEQVTWQVGNPPQGSSCRTPEGQRTQWDPRRHKFRRLRHWTGGRVGKPPQDSIPPHGGGALPDGGEGFAGGDGGAFLHGDGEHGAGADGLHFVLHLHGFDYEDALAGFYF